MSFFFRSGLVLQALGTTSDARTSRVSFMVYKRETLRGSYLYMKLYLLHVCIIICSLVYFLLTTGIFLNGKLSYMDSCSPAAFFSKSF